MPYERGVPSHDTFTETFARLDTVEFYVALESWVMSIANSLRGETVAFDGKMLRGSFDKASGRSPLHSVLAWACGLRMCVGLQSVDEKSNEITALPELLKILQLKGAIVTIDAMGCQKEIAEQIVQQAGQYILAVKDNQSPLRAALQSHFTPRHYDNNFRRTERRVTKDESHGRVEERLYYSVPLPPELAWIDDEWKDFRSLGQSISYIVREGRQTDDVRYFISNLPANAKPFGDGVRGHWSIENGQPWVLYVTFREDECRIRKDEGPQNFARLRRIAVNILRQDKSKGSIRRKRKRVAWNENELLKMIQAAR